MPLSHFNVLNRKIRFDDQTTRSQHRKTDKLAAIRDVWDKSVAGLPQVFSPGLEVTVDERLVPFRGCCHFKRYMPNTPAKYGIKMCAAYDVKTSYAWNMQVYTSKLADRGLENNLGMRVELDMITDLRGHNITCPNFFTSYALEEELLHRKLTMLGTVHRNQILKSFQIEFVIE